MAKVVSPLERKVADEEQNIIKQNTELLTGAQDNNDQFKDDEGEGGGGGEGGEGKKKGEKGGDWAPGSSKLSNLMKGTKLMKELSSFKSSNRDHPIGLLNKYFEEAKKSFNFTGQKQAGAHYFAQQYMREEDKKNKKGAFEAYMEKIKTSLRDENEVGWQKLGGIWDKLNKIWSIKGNKMLERKVNYIGKNRNAKALGEFNTQILQQKLSKPAIKEYVPSMVYELMKSNLTLSKYGIGRVSQKSLPFYAGRYLDPFTGRIKTMQMMSQKYLNPTSYKQHLFYLQSKIIAKWNSFVRAQEEYLRHTTKNPQQWNTLKKNTIIRNMNKNDNIQTAFSNLYKQVQIWRAGLPSSQSISLVCEKCLQNLGADEMNKFIELIQSIGITSKQQVWTNNQVEGQRLKYLQQLNKAYKAIPAPNKDTASVDEIRQYAKITGAFSLWANKGMASTQRAVKKYIRTFIPDDLPVDKIAQVSAQLKNADEKINSVYGRLKKDGDDYAGMKNFKAGANADEFITSLGMFEPKGERTLTILPMARTSKKGQAVKAFPQKFALKF